MSNFYLNLAYTASRLLNTFGLQASVKITSRGTYDAVNSVYTPVVETKTRKVALFDFPTGTTDVRGTTIQATDKRCLLEAKIRDAQPIPESQIIIRGKVYSVVSAVEINPAGTPVLFDLHVRG